MPSSHRHSAKPQTLAITALHELGYGIGQKAGQTLTVARTAPGDQVLVGPPRSSDRWSSAELLRVVKGGPGRVDPHCPAFEAGCAGCQWLHLSYATQLEWKQRNLADQLHKRAGFKGVIQPLVPCGDPEAGRPQAYRNKLSLKNVEGRLVFVPEQAEAPVAPGECFVQTEALQRAWAVLRPRKVPRGVEQLHLRSNGLGQVGLHAFVQDPFSRVEAELQELLQAVPGAVGLGASSRSGYRVLGEPTLVQTLGTTSWLIPHSGFFQTNAALAGRLLEVTRAEARVTSEDRVLDLYCGAGFFGLALAGAREVVGIEENAASVAAAQASARASGVGNARFLTGDLGTVLQELPRDPREVAVVDPPREGLLPRALEALINRKPKRIVYVSCYPVSLIRDFKALSAAGWRGVSATPLDMFPHTSHIEVVLTLER